MYIGAENIISPLGFSVSENFENLQNSISGIKLFKHTGFDKKDLYLSKIEHYFNNFSFLKFDTLLIESINKTVSKLNSLDLSNDKLIVIISSTKGNIDKLNEGSDDFSLVNSAKTIKNHFNLKNNPLIISNACISGVVAINTASNLIENTHYEQAIVIGADIISEFVLWGFQSLFAISDEKCKPFDKTEKV